MGTLFNSFSVAEPAAFQSVPDWSAQITEINGIPSVKEIWER